MKKEITYRDIEIEWMKEILREKEEHIKKIEKENKELKGKIRFLEQCLDNKEKVNKSLREELEKLKVKYWDLDY